MKNFYKFDDSGRFLSILHLSQEEAALQGSITEDPPGFLDGFWPYFEGGVWTQRPTPQEATPMLSDMRASAYPQIGDQLDALWHAMDRGDIPVAAEFFEMIKAVKDRYPKGVPMIGGSSADA